MNSQQTTQAEAAYWVVALAGEEVDEQQREQFIRWCEADIQHAQAFWAADRVWQGIEAIFTPGVIGASVQVQ